MSLTLKNRPRLSSHQVRDFVRDFYGIDGSLTPLPAEWDQNFRLDAGCQGIFTVKIANRDRSREVLDFENAAMDLLSRRWSSTQSPRVVASRSGNHISQIDDGTGRQHLLRVLSWIEGQPLSGIPTPGERPLEELGSTLGELDVCLSGFTHPAMNRELRWNLDAASWISSHTSRIRDPRRRGIVEWLLLQYCGRVAQKRTLLPTSVIHNDANDENVLVARTPSGGWKVTGIVDFGDMLRSSTVNELAIAAAYASFGAEEPLGAIAAMASGYHRARNLDDSEMEVLFPLVCMRLCVSVTNSAMAADEDPENTYRQISDRQAWDLLERLVLVDWLEAERYVERACGAVSRPSSTTTRPRWARKEILTERGKHIGPSLRLSYEEPLLIEKGRGAYLFGPSGQAYLDCVNNVCHVGHCHPKVVEALFQAASTLNTNTRYLHPDLVAYAKRLTATLPEPLSVCFFVNSGSEANDLAVRMARTCTGRRDVIVLEDAYHGNTETLVSLSPYKCEGPGGGGLASWVHKVAKPDSYRGAHRGAGKAAGCAYAEEVGRTCERLVGEKRPPALFLCESVLGCAGQIVLPDGYLREAFRRVRSIGGICLVDEVQVGFGRVGSHMWAFETQGVVPDIVTLGKPIGNGHPIGAVITTAEIAAAFADGMEFFSTFGGNPVSAAVGLAVLDVIEDERLQDRAARVGAYLRDGFQTLAERHELIGDVRGLGLFLGVELVRDRETRAPATEETSRLIEQSKNDGVLLSVEGPFHNVIKIKPPLVFGETEADLLLGAVDRALTPFRA